MDPRLACQLGTSDDLTKQLGYGSDLSMSPVMWNGEEFYPREGGDAYHVTTGYPPQGGGGPSGGPQMRTMSLAPMTQTPQQQGPAPTSTPPGDISKLHMQGPAQLSHGGQMQIPFQVSTAQRPNAPNYTFQARAAAPRMSNRSPMYSVSGNGQQIMTPAQGMGPVSYVPYPPAATMPLIYQQATPRINSNAASYYAAGPQQPQVLISTPAAFNNSFTMPWFPGSIRGAAPQGNIAGPHQTQQQPAQHGPSPQVSLMPMQQNIMQSVNTPSPGGTSTATAQNPGTRVRKHALAIIDPGTGRNVVEDMEKESTASGGSSNRETPQPEPSQNHDVAAEFAERVNKAASEDTTPSAPTQPPDPVQQTSSINGPEPSSDLSLSQPSYVEETGSLGTPWNKGMGHKGPGDISEKPHDSAHVYYYPSVISSHAPNVSAKAMEMGPTDMYQTGMTVPIMIHQPVMPGRQGASLPNSLALSEQTPVVSANTNAPSVPVEVYREPYPAISSRGPQQAGSGGSSGHPGHPSPNRRKRQDSNATTAAPTAPSLESQALEGKHSKKGSPTPGSGPAQSQGPNRPAAGPGAPKEVKRDKGREKASTPKDKDVPKEILLSDPKGKTSPPLTATPAPVPVAVGPASSPVPEAPTPSSAPAAVPATAASAQSPPSMDPIAEKTIGIRSRQASSESLTDGDGKASSRNKGKKMRDAKSTEKEGSDVEAVAEPAVEDGTVSGPAPTLVPPVTAPATVPAADGAVCESTPDPGAASVPAPTPDTQDTSPVLEVPAGGSMELEKPSSTTAPAVIPVTVPAVAQPDESGVALKTGAEVPQVSPSPPISAPAPAVVPVPSNVPAPVPSLSLKTVNMFNPDFMHSPTTPPLLTKFKRVVDDGEKEDADKEDKLVAAKNEENNKVSGVLKDDQAEKKRIYGADQWSPNNPEGKKKYDRNFLMDLRGDPQSQKKPDGLPDMDVVLKESNKKAMQNSFCSEFSPAGFVRSSGSRGPPPKRNSQQGKPKQGKPAMVHLSISLRENVKLHETENAWKPGVLGGKEPTEEDAATQDLYKRFRGILNKLTPEKFEKLVSQVQELPIDNLDRLKGVINLVFDKAVDEPNFSVAYAKLCNELRSKEVQIGSNAEDMSSLTFRKILITRCQQEFEKNKAAENNKDGKLKEIEAEPDPEKRKELQIVFEEEERRVRMKSVGNIRFIGELYKLGMLTGQIMHRCVDELLSKNEEESLECLCKLLTTIGKKLEFEYSKGSDVLNDYWLKMKDLADKKGKGRKISSRVRFMLQDVLDLRANKWVPRRDDSNPKTMDQIQKEAERDLMDTNLALSQPNTPRKDDRGRGGMDKRGGRGGQNTAEEGWKMAPSRSSRAPVDMSKLKTSKVESESLGSPNLFSKWGGGSTVKEPSQTKKAPSIINANPYSALEKTSIYNSTERLKQMTPLPSPKERTAADRLTNSRSSSQQRGSSQPASRDSSSVRGDRDDERRNRVPTPSAGSASPVEQSVNERSSGSETGPVCKGKRLEDPEEIERSARNLIQELLGHEDLKEAALAVKDYFDWSNIGDFARECMLFMCDRTSGHQLVSNFFLHLHKENYLRNSHLVKALTEVIEFGPDLVIDIPKVWSHIAALIAPLLIGEAVTFKDLSKASSVLKGTPAAGVLLNNIIQILVKEKTPSWIKQHWDSSEVSWTDFLDAAQVDEFIKENQLESFSSGALASRTEMTQQEIQAKLLELLSPEAKNSFDAIVEWIEANVREKSSENFFIRALMTAVCENAIKENASGKYVLVEDRLKQHEKLVTRYVDNVEELELQCLYAIQALINRLEHPQGLILSIFSVLWDTASISSEAFLSWFNSKDPQEMEGKGVCSTSLTSFQTLLTEVDDDADEES